MSFLFSRPQATAVTSASATSYADQNRHSVEAAQAQAQFIEKKRGYASTILTGPQGVPNMNPQKNNTLG